MAMTGPLSERSGNQLNSPFVSCSAYLSTRWASAALNGDAAAAAHRNGDHSGQVDHGEIGGSQGIAQEDGSKGRGGYNCNRQDSFTHRHPSTVSGLVGLMNLVLERLDDIAAMTGFQIPFQSLQRDTDDVAVVEPGTDAGVRAKPQPDAMQAVDVLGP